MENIHWQSIYFEKFQCNEELYQLIPVSREHVLEQQHHYGVFLIISVD